MAALRKPQTAWHSPSVHAPQFHGVLPWNFRQCNSGWSDAREAAMNEAADRADGKNSRYIESTAQHKTDTAAIFLAAFFSLLNTTRVLPIVTRSCELRSRVQSKFVFCSLRLS